MIVKTFKQIQDDVLGWFDELNTSSSMRASVQQAINAAQTARLGSRNWPFMKWPERVSFTTVASQRAYVLHSEFFRPIYFYNTATGIFQRQTMVSTPKSTVSYDNFELAGTSPVSRQPASPSQLTLTSTSGSDGTNQQMVIYGEESTSGLMVSETISVGGSPTTQAFKNVIRLRKVGTWAGTAILSAGATELLRLGATEAGRTHQMLSFLLAPTSASLIEYEFYRQPNLMTADEDIPDIPSPFQEILTYDTLMQLAAYNPVERDSVKLWSIRQMDLYQGMLETYGQALSLEREPTLTPWKQRE